MGVYRVIISALLMGCLATALPLDNPPSIKADEVAPLGPEAREEPSTSQVSENKPTVHQFGVVIPELKQTQFQSFDNAGRYSFGYAYPEQVHMESRSEDGLVSGSYYYRDPNGLANQVQYLADSDGFRVSANNLPVFVPGEQPEPVRDTPEVEEAKRKHLETWQAVAKHNQAQNAKDAIKESESPVISEFKNDVPAEDDDKESISVDSFTSTKVARDNVPSIKPLDPDVIVDDEKQAVITELDESIDPESAAVIDVESEPIRLLAQLYAKHINDMSEPPRPIERPEGFHPQNLLPAVGYDLFSRSQANDAIEVLNPEFIDLKAFLLNRFRNVPQLLNPTEEKATVDQPVHDLTTSEQDSEEDSSFDPSDDLSQELYNYYYGIPYNKPVALTRETLNKLPESLRLAISGAGAIDGHHDAQIAPSSDQTRYQELLQRLYSPYYNSYSSPYYFSRNSNPYYHPYNYNPYYHAAITPYSAQSYYYNHPYYSY